MNDTIRISVRRGPSGWALASSTSTQLRATPDDAEGQWVQFQPWIYDDGHALLRSSRLHVRFRPTDAGWRISRYRTENLFVAPLPDRWWNSHLDRSVLMSSLDVAPQPAG